MSFHETVLQDAKIISNWAGLLSLNVARALVTLTKSSEDMAKYVIPGHAPLTAMFKKFILFKQGQDIVRLYLREDHKYLLVYSSVNTILPVRLGPGNQKRLIKLNETAISEDPNVFNGHTLYVLFDTSLRMPRFLGCRKTDGDDDKPYLVPINVFPEEEQSWVTDVVLEIMGSTQEYMTHGELVGWVDNNFK